MNNVPFYDRVLMEALLSFAANDPQSCLYENTLR